MKQVPNPHANQLLEIFELSFEYFIVWPEKASGDPSNVNRSTQIENILWINDLHTIGGRSWLLSIWFVYVTDIRKTTVVSTMLCEALFKQALCLVASKHRLVSHSFLIRNWDVWILAFSMASINPNTHWICFATRSQSGGGQCKESEQHIIVRRSPKLVYTWRIRIIRIPTGHVQMPSSGGGIPCRQSTLDFFYCMKRTVVAGNVNHPSNTRSWRAFSK